MDLNHVKIEVGDLSFILSAATLNYLLVCLILAVLFIYLGRKVNQIDPQKTLDPFALIVNEIGEIFNKVIGDGVAKGTLNYSLFTTLFLVILLSNFLGMVDLQPPTSNIGVNIALSLIVFVVIHFQGLKHKGIVGRIKELASPSWIFLPINFVSELTMPLSLCLRLFGNIISGAILGTLVYTFVAYLKMYGLLFLLFTPLFHAYFDVFAGTIQAYVFVSISVFFLNQISEE